MRSGQRCPDLKGECGESRTLSATNSAVSGEFMLGDNKFIFFVFCVPVDEQSTHTSSRQEESNCLMTSGARKGNPTVEFSIAMASQFTASEDLNGMRVISPTICELRCVEQYLEP